MSKKRSRRVPRVRLESSTYQPTRAEIEEDVSIDARPRPWPGRSSVLSRSSTGKPEPPPSLAWATGHSRI